MRLTTISLAAVLLATPVFAESHSEMDHSKMGHGTKDHSTMDHGTMDHGTKDHSTMDHGTMDHSKMDHGTMDHSMMEGVHTTATINSIDGETYNVTHPPIPKLKWPAMTMDLKLLEGAEIGEVAEGDSAMLMLEQGADGMYGIKAIVPAE